MRERETLGILAYSQARSGARFWGAGLAKGVVIVGFRVFGRDIGAVALSRTTAVGRILGYATKAADLAG